ncbi:16872_t:CDS:2 [Cetraspora pellucida]|uniref:16872_t:CDS:1 n=1 Tax=Cetraspora pellucida TaxID=1433469 RepID=A0A9N8ZKG7_9GLOM|nr:16872_t:CDS:2 [Cetraspora pellucida]
MSYHISTFGMKLKNIAQVAVFTELIYKKLLASLQKKSIIDNIANKSSFSLQMLESPKYNEKTKEHVREKKAINPKNRTVFDFMICPPNDESEVIKSSLLDIAEPEVKRSNEDTNSGLYFDMVPKLDLAKYEVNLVELALNTKFFNLFLGFLAKPVMGINKEIIDLIFWHVLNIICNKNEELNEPENKPRTILVLKSTLQQCGKNIITDFIDDKVLGSHLYFTMSDLEKILGFNKHLKSLITERMVAIECKGLETIRINDYAGYMITREILDHPNASGVVISYLLSCDLSNWSLGKIPTTKMKIETIYEKVYQDYLKWCSCNEEKLLTSKVAGKKFSQIGIDRACLQDNRVRVYQYILDHPKIVTKFRESSLNDIEEFSNTPQSDLSKNKTTNMLIFNVPEFIPSKIITSQAEKNLSPSDKKEDKQKNLTQALFDYMKEEAEAPVASTSGTSKTSKMSNLPEPKIIEQSQKDQTSKLPESIKLISGHEEHLRKRAIELEAEEDPKEYMNMSVQERLIEEEIIHRDLENKEITSSWLNTDEE